MSPGEDVDKAFGLGENPLRDDEVPGTLLQTERLMQCWAEYGKSEQCVLRGAHVVPLVVLGMVVFYPKMPEKELHFILWVSTKIGKHPAGIRRSSSNSATELLGFPWMKGLKQSADMHG